MFLGAGAGAGGADMSITTEEAERLVELGKVVPDGSRRIAAAISALATERDALRAENARLRARMAKLEGALGDLLR